MSRVTPGPELPEDTDSSCTLNINDDETLLVKAEAFVFNHTTRTWTKLASQFTWRSPSTPRNWFRTACGLTFDAQGRPKHAVLAGGKTAHNQVQLLDIETRLWSDGPSLPLPSLEMASVVPYGRSFLVVGGNGQAGSQDAIFQFDPDRLEWIEREERLPAGRHGMHAVFVDEEDVSCS